jgi:two-component system sensor histidine kinase HydH
MAAGVAHEIRNPLNAISMGLQSLAIQGGETADSTAKSSVELLETLRREVASINRIVSEFLSVSRPENLEVEELNAAELLDHVCSLLHQTAAEQGVEVRLDKGGSGCRVSGDRDKLTQALLNVCVNALEACDTGGVITLRLICRKDLARIEVDDTGPGISPEDKINLFRPHFTTKEKGLGLGLFLAQRILQAHGGNLFLEKSSSQGTTMVLTVLRASD